MTQDTSCLDETVPIQLQLRVLRAELEQIDEDMERLRLLRDEISEEICDCESLLVKKKRRGLLQRVK